MKKLIVHPGMPKSGSTSIQIALERTRIGDASWNLLDFDFNGANSSLFLASAFSTRRRSKIPESLQNSLFKEERVARRMLEFQDSKSKLSVISAEGLWGWGDEEFKRMIKHFDPDEVSVRVVIRDPWTSAGSFFQQQLKSGKAELSVPEIDYRTSLRKFEKFGLQVFDLSPFLADPFIAPQLPQRVFPEIEMQPEPTVRNKSISWLAAIFLFRLNRNLNEKHLKLDRGSHDRRSVVQIAREIPGPKFMLRSAEVPWAKDQADYVEARFGIVWKPMTVNEGRYSMSDLSSRMSKSDADIVREWVSPHISSFESKALRSQVTGVLESLDR